ncbi:MAG: diguanylate cyclase [Pseudomonadota bacterium]
MNTVSLLIVDDRPENLLTLESLLEEPGLTIVRAGSGNEALSRTLDHEFALILLDVQMPGMDGYETAELLRSNSRTRNIPIIFVTAALKDREHMFKGYGSGAVDYLFKPLEPAVLQSKVTIFLDLYRHRILLEEKTRELDAKVAELEKVQKELEATNAKLQRLSSRDGLTDLPNRRFFDETLAREWLRAKRTLKPMSLLIADIDHFKAYNDSYGHLLGDQCLKQVARGLEKSLFRDADVIARYGGEEFAAILPETDESGGERIAKRMLDAISSQGIVHNGSKTSDILTISLGLSTAVPSSGFTATELLERADKALYLAKEAGRNCYRIVR